MLAAGTNVTGVMFIIVALIVLVLIGRALYQIWNKYAIRVREAKEKEVTYPTIEVPIILTLLLVAVYIVGLTLGWNAIQDVSTTMSSYKSQAEVAEQKKIQESQLPSQEKLDQTRTELKQRAEVKPHKEAIESFDESMQKEADKIRKRSLEPNEGSK